MILSASNDVRMIFQGTVEERNKKFPHFKTLLSLTCLHTNALKFHSLLLKFVKIIIQYGNYKEIPSWKKRRRIYVCTPSLDKVLLVTSSTLISEHKSSFMISIITGEWSCCELLTLVMSMWNNHLWAECIENRKEDWTWECPFTKDWECRSISAKPTCIK